MSHIPQAPAREEDLEFKRRPMVGWFDPRQLASTGLKALLSGLFGAYADKREVQAALDDRGTRPPYFDYSDRPELWVDFIADLGDGFDSTYTMARLLAGDRLTVAGIAPPETLPRAQLLVLGGDQVYPTAKREEYRDRFEGPYRSALPWVPEPHAPHLFAIPGNHDWYDGLTSFTRLFCQGRWIGGWKTRQTRSYFAVRLPQGWWLFGIDIQLGADIDRPQLDYFEAITSQKDFAGSRVILCTGEPSWVHANGEDGKARVAYQNLAHFEERIIRRHGGAVELTLTGDLHHYSRYTSADHATHKITAGGGGAYLLGTHHLPQMIDLTVQTNRQQAPTTFLRAAVYPSVSESKKLSARCLAVFPFRCWKFALFLGGFYTFNAWVVQSASRDGDRSLLSTLASLELSFAHIGTVVYEMWRVMAHSPASVIFALVFAAGIAAFADGHGIGKWLRGAIHGASHVALNLGLGWVLGRAGYLLLQPYVATGDTVVRTVDHGANVLLVSLGLFFGGGLLAGVLFALYLFVCDLFFLSHVNETFSAQSRTDFRNFLRVRVDAKGAVTVFPIGVKQVCKRWKFQPGATDGKPFYEWADGHQGPRAELIEPPITLPARARPTAVHPPDDAATVVSIQPPPRHPTTRS